MNLVEEIKMNLRFATIRNVNNTRNIFDHYLLDLSQEVDQILLAKRISANQELYRGPITTSLQPSIQKF